MLLFIGRPHGPKRARSHRNTVSSQRVNIVISQAAAAWNGMYDSCVVQMRWSNTASLRATATTALLLACLPPRAARCRPHCRRAESLP
jgi:hypothetical protein